MGGDIKFTGIKSEMSLLSSSLPYKYIVRDPYLFLDFESLDFRFFPRPVLIQSRKVKKI
jgi:hypothetical protein